MSLPNKGTTYPLVIHQSAKKQKVDFEEDDVCLLLTSDEKGQNRQKPSSLYIGNNINENTTISIPKKKAFCDYSCKVSDEPSFVLVFDGSKFEIRKVWGEIVADKESNTGIEDEEEIDFNDALNDMDLAFDEVEVPVIDIDNVDFGQTLGFDGIQQKTKRNDDEEEDEEEEDDSVLREELDSD